MSEQSTAPGVDEAGDGVPVAASSDESDGASDVAAGSDDGAAARVVGLESADAETVIGAVASDTARSVLAAVDEQRATASGLAERVDCSLQTVQYHLGKLSEAGLVEVAETATSEKGQEMDVYATARRPVVVYAGDDDDGDDLRSMLSRLVSGVAFLGLLSLLVQELFGRAGPVSRRTQDLSVEYAVGAADGAGAAGGVAPGLLFFAGGLVVLVAYLAAWYLRRRGVLDGLGPADS